MASFTQVFGGSVISPSNVAYLLLALTEDVVLLWPTEQQVGGPLIVAGIIDLDASVGGLTVTMPDATLVSTGTSTLFNNVGASTVSILDANGGTIVTLASGEAWQIYLTDNSIEEGAWRVFQYGAGTSSANASALAGAGLKAITTTLNQKMTVVPKNTNYVILNADRAKAFNWTGGNGAFTLPDPATVGNDWFVAIRNTGAGNLVVTPAAGTIDGSASKTFSTTTSALIITDGTNYFTVGFGQTINSVFDFITINVGGTGDYVLNAAEQNRIAYDLTGVLTGNRNIVVPDFVQQYWVDNETTGAFTLIIKTLTGGGFVLPQGQRAILYSNGVDIVTANTVVVSTPVAVNQGGTGSTTAAGARTNLGSSAVGDAIFVAANAGMARAALGSTTVGDAVFIAASAAAARTALGSTTVGDAVFIAASVAAARSALGSTTVGDAVFIAASTAAGRTALGAGALGSILFLSPDAANARTVLGSTTIGDALFITAGQSQARTTLGSTTVGDAVFTAATALIARTAIGVNVAGLIPTAQLGSGSASSSTVLFGDQTYKAIATAFGFKIASGIIATPGAITSGVNVGTANHVATGSNTVDVTPAGFTGTPAVVAQFGSGAVGFLQSYGNSNIEIQIDTQNASHSAADAVISFIAIGP